MAKKQTYGNDSIKSLKGADRVRLRPAVIFGSDGLDGASTRFSRSLELLMRRARATARRSPSRARPTIPLRWKTTAAASRWITTSVRERYNWELVFCEMYAGGKYNNNDGGNYDYALGLNGLGLCATQYASEYMDADIRYDGLPLYAAL